MKSQILLCFIILFNLGYNVNAQSIKRSSINSFGSIALNGGLKLSQSVGQSSAVQIKSNNKIQLRQGFQQAINLSYYNSRSSLDINVYPNPTQNNINISFDNDRQSIFSYYLYDSQGRICQFEEENKSKNIQLKNNLTPGVYTIRVLVENKVGVSSLIIIP